MTQKATERKKLRSPARRHFLAAVSAAGARIAALGALAAVTPSSANAFGFRKGWGGAKKPKPGGGGDSSGPACFLRGTHILTERGEVPVEALKPGDLVRTASGGSVPVRWIGRASYAKSGADWRDEVKPIRIARSAISEGVPHRDLYVSPWHFLYLGGHLIPAKDLVNEATITAEAPAGVSTIEYFHILLDRHDALLAEGAAAESLLLQADEYGLFANAADFEGSDGIDATPFAPRVWYSGGRSHVAALLRLGVSRIVDVSDPIQKVGRQLAIQARSLAA